MSIMNSQELQVVQAFSSVDIPDRIFRESNIKELIRGMTEAQESVTSDARRLERLRQEKKDGNFLGNWWHDREDQVQDAQVDLNKSIGRLTQKSSQLLVVNTAISKVLSDQQRILLEQQGVLKIQASRLEDQNKMILDQQNQLAAQQREINAANQGLMEAKGITQEQAQKLVGCVVRVTEAEKKIGAANEELVRMIEERLQGGVGQCLAQLNEGLSKLGQSQDALKRELSNAMAAEHQRTEDELRSLAKSSDAFKSDIVGRLEAHIKFDMEKSAAQDSALELVRDESKAQMTNLQEQASSLAQAVLAQQEAIKAVDEKTRFAQEEQRKALEAQLELLERSQQQLGDDLRREVESLKLLGAQLASLRTEHDNAAAKNRRGLAVTVCIALSSLGWLVAQRFAML